MESKTSVSKISKNQTTQGEMKELSLFFFGIAVGCILSLAIATIVVKFCEDEDEYEDY